MEDKSQISDGYHTFEELYNHRHALFIALCNMAPAVAWKSKQHDDGSMFEGGWFIAGIETPLGNATYHLPIQYWESLHCRVFEKAPAFDGHTPADVIDRIFCFGQLKSNDLYNQSRHKGELGK